MFQLSLALFLLVGQNSPLPDKLLTAKTAYLVNEGVDAKTFDNLWKEMSKWKRFDIVGDKAGADIAITLFLRSETIPGAIVYGVIIPSEHKAFYLRITDFESSTPLWSDRADVGLSTTGALKKLISNLRKRMDRKIPGNQKRLPR